MAGSSRFLKNVDSYFSVILLFILTAVVFLEVVFRYVFLMPQVYSGELARLLHAYIVFIGLARAEWQNDNICIDFFKNKLVPSNYQSILDVVFLFLQLFVAIIVVIGSFQVVIRAGKMPSVGMGAPVLVFFLPNIVGFGLLVFTLLWKIGTRFKIVGRNAIFNKNNGGL